MTEMNIPTHVVLPDPTTRRLELAAQSAAAAVQRWQEQVLSLQPQPHARPSPQISRPAIRTPRTQRSTLGSIWTKYPNETPQKDLDCKSQAHSIQQRGTASARTVVPRIKLKDTDSVSSLKYGDGPLVNSKDTESASRLDYEDQVSDRKPSPRPQLRDEEGMLGAPLEEESSDDSDVWYDTKEVRQILSDATVQEANAENHLRVPDLDDLMLFPPDAPPIPSAASKGVAKECGQGSPRPLDDRSCKTLMPHERANHSPIQALDDQKKRESASRPVSKMQTEAVCHNKVIQSSLPVNGKEPENCSSRDDQEMWAGVQLRLRMEEYLSELCPKTMTTSPKCQSFLCQSSAAKISAQVSTGVRISNNAENRNRRKVRLSTRPKKKASMSSRSDIVPLRNKSRSRSPFRGKVFDKDEMIDVDETLDATRESFNHVTSQFPTAIEACDFSPEPCSPDANWTPGNKRKLQSTPTKTQLSFSPSSAKPPSTFPPPLDFTSRDNLNSKRLRIARPTEDKTYASPNSSNPYKVTLEPRHGVYSPKSRLSFEEKPGISTESDTISCSQIDSVRCNRLEATDTSPGQDSHSTYQYSAPHHMRTKDYFVRYSLPIPLNPWTSTKERFIARDGSLPFSATAVVPSKEPLPRPSAEGPFAPSDAAVPTSKKLGDSARIFSGIENSKSSEVRPLSHPSPLGSPARSKGSPALNTCPQIRSQLNNLHHVIPRSSTSQDKIDSDLSLKPHLYGKPQQYREEADRSPQARKSRSFIEASAVQHSLHAEAENQPVAPKLVRTPPPRLTLVQQPQDGNPEEKTPPLDMWKSNLTAKIIPQRELSTSEQPPSASRSPCSRLDPDQILSQDHFRNPGISQPGYKYNGSPMSSNPSVSALLKPHKKRRTRKSLIVTLKVSFDPNPPALMLTLKYAKIPLVDLKRKRSLGAEAEKTNKDISCSSMSDAIDDALDIVDGMIDQLEAMKSQGHGARQINVDPEQPTSLPTPATCEWTSLLRLKLAPCKIKGSRSSSVDLNSPQRGSSPPTVRSIFPGKFGNPNRRSRYGGLRLPMPPAAISLDRSALSRTVPDNRPAYEESAVPNLPIDVENARVSGRVEFDKVINHDTVGILRNDKVEQTNENAGTEAYDKSPKTGGLMRRTESHEIAPLDKPMDVSAVKQAMSPEIEIISSRRCSSPEVVFLSQTHVTPRRPVRRAARRTVYAAPCVHLWGYRLSQAPPSDWDRPIGHRSHPPTYSSQAVEKRSKRLNFRKEISRSNVISSKRNPTIKQNDSIACWSASKESRFNGPSPRALPKQIKGISANPKLCREITACNQRIQTLTLDNLGPWRTWKGASADIVTLAWAPQGSLFAVGAAAHMNDEDLHYNRPCNLVIGNVAQSRLWELPDHRIPRRRPEIIQFGPGASRATYDACDPFVYQTISHLAYSVCGKYLFSASHDHTVRVWEVNEGRYACRQILTHDSAVTSLCAGPGVLATAAEQTHDAIRIYNDDRSSTVLSSRRALERPQANILPESLRWGPNNLLLGSFTSWAERGEGHLCLWDVVKGEELVVRPSTFDATALAWNPTQSLFAAGGSCRTKGGPRDTLTAVRVWDPRTPHQQICEVESPAAEMLDVTFHPLNPQIVTAGCSDNSSYVWDCRFSDRALHRFCHGPPLLGSHDGMGVGFSSWGQYGALFYSGASDGVVKAWDWRRSSEDAWIKDIGQVGASIQTGAFSPDHSHLLVGDGVGAIHLLSAEAGGQTWGRSSRVRRSFMTGLDKEQEPRCEELELMRDPKGSGQHMEIADNESEPEAIEAARELVQSGRVEMHTEYGPGASNRRRRSREGLVWEEANPATAVRRRDIVKARWDMLRTDKTKIQKVQSCEDWRETDHWWARLGEVEIRSSRKPGDSFL